MPRISGPADQIRRFGNATTLDIEELFLEAGATPLAAKSRAVFNLYSPPNDQLTALVDHLRDLHSRETSPTASAEIAARGAALGNHLSQGGGSRILPNQTLGLHIECLVLKTMEPNAPSPYSGRPAGEVLAEIRTQQDLFSDIDSIWDRALTKEEVQSYYDRVLLFGEGEALKWLKALPSRPTREDIQ